VLFRSACAPALDAWTHPSEPDEASASAWLTSRHLAEDGGETLAVSYVRTKGDPRLDALVAERLSRVDPDVVLTGYPFLERGLASTLAHDLPLVGLAALVLVGLALAASLRSLRDVVLACATLGFALALVGVAMRVLDVRWHAYDALVVPVLLGITMDEAMFLLHAAQGAGDDLDASIDRALREQGPLVLSTALTTSAGFGALVVCRFDGLRDVGAVGALGSIAGLVAALVVIPAGLRLARRAPSRA
jgi:predicted RND superfamily exporter protein